MARPFLVDAYLLTTDAPRDVVARILGEVWTANKARAKFPINELPDGYQLQAKRFKMHIDLIARIKQDQKGCQVAAHVRNADIWQQKLFALIPIGKRHSYGAKEATTVMKNFAKTLENNGHRSHLAMMKAPLGTPGTFAAAIPISLEGIADEYPSEYPTALGLLTSLGEAPPTNPEAWLRELCKRIHAGSSAAAAAARIPIDIS